MRKAMSGSGFTLIEMLVVVMIIGILAAVGIPRYMKTVETSRAHDAIALVQVIAQANRMRRIDNGNTYTDCATMDNSCALVTGNYLARADWGTLPYTYCAGNNNCSGAIASCQRRAGNYSAWGYTVSDTGVVTPVGSAPPP